MIAISVWYVPPVFAALVAHGTLNVAALFVSAGLGLFFWLPLFSPWKGQRLKPVPAGIIYLLCATIFASFIGVALTFARPEVYANYVNPKDSLGILASLQTKWDLARDRDQQTAGLLMWIGSCTFFLSAVMLMFYRLYVTSRAESR
jgi:cytochrome c oxidase assembly factor CtaG